MSHELIDCTTHRIVGGYAISEDTSVPRVHIFTAPYDAKNPLPVKLFTSGEIKADTGEKPWSSSHLSNHELIGDMVTTQASKDINYELFARPFTPQVAVFETFPESEEGEAHWHLKISPFMDRKTQEELHLFLTQFDPGIKESIGRDIAHCLPFCELGKEELLSYRSESVEIETDEEGDATLRYGLKLSSGWGSECELPPIVDDSEYIKYETYLDISDIFSLLSDLPVPAWEVKFGVSIKRNNGNIFEALDKLRQKKGGFTVSEVYEYVQPYVQIRRKEEGGVK